MSSDWVKPPVSISALQALVGNTKRALQCFGYKLYKLCVTHGHNFSKTTYPAVRNSSRWSTKMSIWICWDVGVKIASDFQTSGLHNYLVEVVQIVFTCKAFGETLQLRDRGCTWCFFAPKGTLCCFDLEATKFHLESDGVICSPEIFSGGFTQSLLIFVDIECIDYSWIFDYRVSRFLKNRARESRFL